MYHLCSAGYPIATYLTKATTTSSSPLHLGLNATGQVPSIPGNWGLIDKDTPPSARTKVDYVTGATWTLVFSDEFNTDGRTFYPGDDPYWEAVDLHYWATGNKEWYDPAAVATRNGSLEITLARRPSHGLEYTGGMVQTWNKFCFTGGLVETAVMLPGFNNVQGLWPAVWAMGNLGRAGYGATLEGMVRPPLVALLSLVAFLNAPLLIVDVPRRCSGRIPTTRATSAPHPIKR